MTGHVSKGTTKDEIILDEDINKMVMELRDKPQSMLTETERAELALAFICVTRHRHSLINCKFLDI